MTDTVHEVGGTALPRSQDAGKKRSFLRWPRRGEKKTDAGGAPKPPAEKRDFLRFFRWLHFFRWRGTTGRGIAFLLLIGACILRTIDPAPVEMLRLMVFDFYQSIQPRQVTQYPVVIIDIDEASLAEVGQWPWPRTMLADMVMRLTRMGVAAIAFDMIFPEDDRMSPKRVADSLRNLDEKTAAALRKMPSSDRLFALALKRSRVVLGRSVQPKAPEADPKNPPIKTPIAQVGGDPRRFLKERYVSLVRNIPVLEKAAKGRGIILPAIERGGVIRRVPAVIQVGKDLYPALTIELLRVATGKKAFAIKSSKDGITGVVVAGKLIPTDGEGRMWIYFGPHERKRFVSAKDVLNGTAPKARFAGKLALVGTSASGLHDIRATPLGVAVPGVEIHAQLLENILAETHLSRPAYALGAELAFTLVAGLLIIVLLPVIGARWTLLLFGVVAGGSAITSWYMYTEQHMMIDFVFPIIVTFLNHSYLTYTSHTRAEAQRQEVRAAFSQYLSPALVEQLAADPSKLSLGGETKEMTFLFCDVRGFTSISERFKHDPQALTRLINQFLTPMTDAILSRNGTVDKYMGDCIMAFWNAPLDDPDHADNACTVALDMRNRLKPLNEELKAEAEASDHVYMPIEMGIGVNTGECVVGNMGSDQRFDYSVLGDSVNLASRLEGHCKTYGVGIVVGQDTQAKVNGYAALELDLIAVKGKQEAAHVYALLGDDEVRASQEFQELEARQNEMLAAYRGQEWQKARELVAECRRLDGRLEKFYDLYEERIGIYELEPPGPDWDGVFVATTK